jgi:hypothetical protein
MSPSRPLADVLEIELLPQAGDEATRAVLSSGMPFPSPVTVRAKLPDRPELELRLEVRDGEVALTRLTVHARETDRGISTSVLKDLPLKAVIYEVTQRVATMYVAFEEVSLALEQPGRRYAYLEPKDGRFGVRDDALGVRRRRLITDDLLREVAEAAQSDPVRPNEAVRKAMHTSVRTASRWITEAKKRGFLNEEND